MEYSARVEVKSRYLVIWFPQLMADWFIWRNPEHKNRVVVFSKADRGRMILCSCNKRGFKEGIQLGIPLADARALVPDLLHYEEDSRQKSRLLRRFAEWMIRFTPVIAIWSQETLVLDASGCTHLWGSEAAYIKCIYNEFKEKGFYSRIAMADTIGAAWALAHYAQQNGCLTAGEEQLKMLKVLPPVALRIDPLINERLLKLGMSSIENLLAMPVQALRKRFGALLTQRLAQATGDSEEWLEAFRPVAPYEETLSSLEPILTATGIATGLRQLLAGICSRLNREGKGLRRAIFYADRLDDQRISIAINTLYPSANPVHLFKLFEEKFTRLEPGPGIELFRLEGRRVEPLPVQNATIWSSKKGSTQQNLAELMDKLSARSREKGRFLPAEHYWPERSVHKTDSFEEQPVSQWPSCPRPVYLLPIPQRIQVSAPLPDYPPMAFNYKGRRHQVSRAEGPERIEQEWWLDQLERRDYYVVEDEEGNRYWLFRSGEWFLHGFFA